MCQPSGLCAWWMPRPVVITTGRGCASPPGLGGLGGVLPIPVAYAHRQRCAALRAKTKQPDLCGRSTTRRHLCGRSTTCGSKPGGLVYPLPGSKAPVAKCIVEAEGPGGPIHRILLATDGHSPDGCASPSGFALGGCPDRWLSPPAEDVPALRAWRVWGVARPVAYAHRQRCVALRAKSKQPDLYGRSTTGPDLCGRSTTGRV